MTFRSDHHFRLWDYHVSHDKLLLRSAVSPSQPYNIDIVFYGVERLDIPTLIMDGLEISGPGQSAGRGGYSHVFQITADGQEYSVVALACYVFKNRLDHMDSVLDLLIGEGETEEMGEVLYRSTDAGNLSGVAGQASA
jgi:hypothetical protein